MKTIKFISASILTLIIMLLIWFFTCFILGYASNSSYQKEIWIAYIVAISIHFFIMIIFNKLFDIKSNHFYLIFNIMMYIIAAWYFYNYS